MLLKAQRHNPCQRRVAQAQPYPLPGAHGNLAGHTAVDGRHIADPAGHGRFHRVAEPCGELPFGVEPPIAQYPQ